jgi:hypothetical protein
MMGLEDFSHWQNQTITIYAYSGFDAYGSPTWSTAGTAYSALVVGEVKSVRDRAGVEKISNTQIYLPGTVTVNIEDKIVLPDGSSPVIIAVPTFPDFNPGDNVLTQVFT